FGKRRPPNLGRHLPACHQRSKIERLQNHALFEMVLVHLGEKEPHELVGRRRILRLVRKAFRLDIKIELPQLRKAEHLVERGHPGARNSLLRWEVWILNRAAIPFTDLCERQFMNHGLVAWTATNRRFENG